MADRDISQKIIALLDGAAKMRRPCLVANRRDVLLFDVWKSIFAEIGISVRADALVPEGQMYLMDEGVFRD